MKEKAILTKLRDFCIENDIDISVGCGCCGAGIYYKKEGVYEEFPFDLINEVMKVR